MPITRLGNANFLPGNAKIPLGNAKSALGIGKSDPGNAASHPGFGNSEPGNRNSWPGKPAPEPGKTITQGNQICYSLTVNPQGRNCIESIRKKSVGLVVVIMTSAIFIACRDSATRTDDQRPKSGTNANMNSLALHVLNEVQAIEIAKKEAEKRGWKDFRQVRCNLDGDKWVVRMEFSPEVYGADARVEIPTNGGPIGYFGGR